LFDIIVEIVRRLEKTNGNGSDGLADEGLLGLLGSTWRGSLAALG